MGVAMGPDQTFLSVVFQLRQQSSEAVKSSRLVGRLALQEDGDSGEGLFQVLART